MDAHFGYIAIVTDQPEKLADFYARHFQTRELGRSEAGDISITDTFLNLTFLKQRPGVEAASGRPGLSHYGIAVQALDEIEARLAEHFPGTRLEPESADLHHGEARVIGPNGLPISLSTRNFGVSGTPRRLPRIRHLATSFAEPNDPQTDFLVKVFGFREVSTSFERRKVGMNVRFVGDGNICLALLGRGGGRLKAGMERPHVDVYRDDAELEVNTRTGLQHFGFVVEDMQAVIGGMPQELARWTNKREARDMAEYRVFDPDLNAIDLSQHTGFEVDYDLWETAAASGVSTEARLAHARS
jgi:hypothetical protein